MKDSDSESVVSIATVKRVSGYRYGLQGRRGSATWWVVRAAIDPCHRLPMVWSRFKHPSIPQVYHCRRNEAQARFLEDLLANKKSLRSNPALTREMVWRCNKSLDTRDSVVGEYLERGRNLVRPSKIRVNEGVICTTN